MNVKSLLISSLLLFCSQLYASNSWPDIEMQLVQLTPHSWYVQGSAGIATDNAGFISNAGVVITDDGVVVFDALGSPALAEMLLNRIRKITDKPVKKVIVSHYHADHIYGLQVFKQAGATIVAPDGVEKYFDSQEAQDRLDERRLSLEPWVNDDTYIVKPDVYVSNHLSFELGGMTFVITRIGEAHSEADLTLFIKEDGVLFSGDILFDGRIPYIGDGDTEFWLDTLVQMETGGLIALVPGHGKASKDPVALISMTRKYLAFLRETMGHAVEEMIPFADIYDKTDWSEYSHIKAFSEANRVNAYQVYLSMESESLSE